MGRRTKRCTASFVGRGEHGSHVRINEFTEFINVSSTDHLAEEIPGMKELMTDDGRHLNRIEKGKYQIVATGEIVVSEDRNAP